MDLMAIIQGMPGSPAKYIGLVGVDTEERLM